MLRHDQESHEAEGGGLNALKKAIVSSDFQARLRTHVAAPLLTSLVVHLVVLMLLAAIILPALRNDDQIGTLVDSDFSEPVQTVIETGVTGSVSESAMPNQSGLQSGKAATTVSSTAQRWNSDLTFASEFKGPNVSLPSDMTLTKTDLTTEIAVPMKYMPLHKHRGEARIVEVEGTPQIAGQLSGDLTGIAGEGDAIVVWLLDQSLSMQRDMKSLAEQLLGTFKQIEEDPSSKMLHYVVAFGDDVRVIQDSTINGYLAAKAIYRLPPDPSGVENTFQAVEWCVDNLFNDRKWKRFKERQKLLVVWTDESGDDYLRMEQTIQKCLASNVRVDVIGPSAVLGAQTGYTAYESPENGLVYQLPVHRGPDSSFPQKLNLTYWYRGVPTSYNEAQRGPFQGTSPVWQGGANLTSMLSGFSPYALTRLTRQTGGRFSIFDRPGDRPPFRLENVQDYMPDYRSLMEIKQDLRQQPLRQVVLAASAVTWQSSIIGNREPQMGFPPQVWGENSLQYQSVSLPQQAKREVEIARNALADVERALAIYIKAASIPGFDPEQINVTRKENAATTTDEIMKEEASSGTGEAIPRTEEKLEISLLEQLYEKEPSKRWRAWCDLNFGRLLAASVRLREFIIVASPLQNKKQNGLGTATNLVSLQQSPQLRGGAISAQRFMIAEKLLTRCIDQNPNTPWAIMAERELRDHCGLLLIERAIPRPKPNLTPVPTPTPQKQPNLPNL